MIGAKNSIIANKFVKLIEENHQTIVERYMNDVLRSDKTISYRNFDMQQLYEVGDRVYREISLWVSKGMSRNEIEMFYEKLGKLRFSQGVPASQVFYALVLLKRNIWFFIKEKLQDDIADYKQLMDLTNRVILFFDNAVLYMLTGQEKMASKMW